MTNADDLRLTQDGRIYRSGRKQYPNGDTYSGEFVDGLREGQGVLTYINGNVYHGQFKGGQFHGIGCMKYGTLIEDGQKVRGRVYEGGWERGLKKGEGVLHTGTGQMFEGRFEADQFHGPGVLRGPGKTVLDGDWKWGKLNGQACCKYPGGVTYSGAMLNAEFHGKGRLVFGKRGGWYEGDFRLGRQDGVGVRTYANGNIYEGSFKDGEASGEGTMRYASGDVYVGEWRRGQKEGKGVMSMANGDRYEGDFLEGHYHGRGRFMWSDGGCYSGDYTATSKGMGHDVCFPLPNGLRHGQGKRVWANGATYDGRWEDDRMEGQGVHVCAEGSRYEGEFRANNRHGQGRCHWGNRHETPFRCPLGYLHAGRGYCVYEGGWKFGCWEGRGTFRCMDDRTAEGTWKQGKLDGWGSSVLMLAHEQGNPKRMFIGGVGGLYRVSKYVGEWRDGVRQGLGIAAFANGDCLLGTFAQAQIDGYGMYIFRKSSRARLGFWSLGTRQRWVDMAEVDLRKPPVAAAMRIVQASPGPFLAGKRGLLKMLWRHDGDLGKLKELWRAVYDTTDGQEEFAKNRNTWAELYFTQRSTQRTQRQLEDLPTVSERSGDESC